MAETPIPKEYAHEDGVYWERIHEKTPAGGGYSEILYFDANENLVSPELASICAIRECLNDGTLVNETFGTV